MSKFSEYLASEITPQMTLLEKFNAVLKFLENSEFSISIVDIDFYNNTGTGNLSIPQVNAIQNADFVRCNNKLFSLAGRFDLRNGIYHQINFTVVNTNNEGDIFLMVVDIDARTFTITGGLG